MNTKFKYYVTYISLMLLIFIIMSSCKSRPMTTPPKENQPMDVLAMYCFDYQEKMMDFWKACGINTLQLIDRACNENDSERAASNARMVKSIEAAHKRGIKVYILVMTNVKDETFEVTRLFHPRNEVEMAERLRKLGEMAAACSMADGFTIFGGDPGGIYDSYASIGMGDGNVDDYIYLVRKFVETIRINAPNAKINLNPWSIAAYQTPDVLPGQVEYWLNETEMTRSFLAAEDIVNKHIGVELALPDYYRGLALRLYDENLSEYPYYPSKEEVIALKNKGVEDIWGWPYFLIDEADNGDGAGTGLQINFRYIYDIVKIFRDFGFNGVVGNYSYVGEVGCAQNTYALCRFAQDASATPEEVLDEYASFVATSETYQTLGAILRYIENHSHWHYKMPENRRLPLFQTPYANASDALAALKSVKPRKAEDPRLFGTPKKFLRLVEAKLQELSK